MSAPTTTANGRGDGVSYGAVKRFMAGSTVAELKKRYTKKSGKGDPASAWCVARPAQVEQWRAQFELGESVPIGGAFAEPFPPLCPYAIAWWDTGRRHRRADGKGDCVRKPGNRQRKAKLVARPAHPELAAAYAFLVDSASARAGLKGGCDVRNIKMCFGLLFG